MPRSEPKKSHNLSVELDNPKPAYRAGDALTGFIVFTPSENGGTIGNDAGHYQLSLFGRAKCTITNKQKIGGMSGIFRGRSSLFETKQKVEISACKLKDSEHAWPFSISIPTSPQAGLVNKAIKDRSDLWTPQTGYLSTEDDVTKHKLPPTYYSITSSVVSAIKAEGYVEYVLTANLGQMTCTLPVVLRVKSTEVPIENIKLTKRSTPVFIRTLKLLPEHDGQQLKFKHKLTSVFSSKTPQYQFDVIVRSPAVIQLYHPKPIAFELSISPTLTDRTTIKAPFPDVKLTSLSLYLEAVTRMRAPTKFRFESINPKITEACVSETPFRYCLAKTCFKNLVIPIVGEPKPSSTSQPILVFVKENPDHVEELERDISVPLSTGSEVPIDSSGALDVGRLLNLRVSRSQSSSKALPRTHSFEQPLWPGFGTYNITVRYDLRWKMNIECAGEKDTIWNLNMAAANCSVIAPSERDLAKEEHQWSGKVPGARWDLTTSAINVVGSVAWQMVQQFLF